MGYGVFQKLGVGVGSDTAATIALEFLPGSSIAATTDVIDSNGIKGTRSRDGSRVREGLIRVNGSIRTEPNAEELEFWVQHALGAAPSGTTYALAETLPVFMAVVDRVDKVFTYTGCVINSATFSSSQGSPLAVSAEIVGRTESVGNSGTFPSLSHDTASGPFNHYDMSTFTLNGTSYPVTDFSVTVSNAVDTERFRNSQTSAALAATDRMVAVSFTLPFGDATAAYATSLTSLVATYANGGVSISFAIPAIKVRKRTPESDGRGEVFLRVDGTAVMSGGTRELVITLDSTP